MSLASYSDLQTAVGNNLARPGDAIVSANVADWITLCESRLAYGAADESPFPSKPLRIRAMETSRVIQVQAVTSGVPVSGSANAIILTPSSAITSYSLAQTWNFAALYSNTSAVTCNISGVGNRNVLKGSALSPLATGDIIAGATVQLYDDGNELVLMPGTANAPLPTNYLAMRALYLDTNPRIKLDYISPEQLNDSFCSTYVDQPRFYTVEADTLRLGTPPDSTYNLVCLYYQKFGALSSATNWLMTNTPNVYLYGTLLEAAIFLQMTEKAQFYYGLFMSACNGLQSQDSRDRHSGASLVIRNDTFNP